MAKKHIEPESCATCRFFQPNDHDEAGWCRRFPPIPIGTENGPCSSQASTSAEEWCGEFSRKLQS